ncbi:DUF3040 domain-containing protein [Couchioplanes azureus]|uniref:DUF3040 domain-containing protein n=1 Tax=Couchioplanes caeruleus TaxID=56438 RepID=UPI00166F949B|nr:DUF3040 domain-containing protein [Couchioplanes caeruleus]GGQ67638.1 hypothetical protein GCM10010166_42030 [Couchioplanes caeruleus subsp. azureus]
MLSKEDSRRLAQLERQLRREDPDFYSRMTGGEPAPRQVPVPLILAATVIWAAALILAVVGWWAAAIVAGVWALVIMAALGHHCRAARRPGPGLLPPAW